MGFCRKFKKLDLNPGLLLGERASNRNAITRVNFRRRSMPYRPLKVVFTPVLLGCGVALRLKNDVWGVAVCAVVQKKLQEIVDDVVFVCVFGFQVPE